MIAKQILFLIFFTGCGMKISFPAIVKAILKYNENNSMP